MRIEFSKMHGVMNDFVVFHDLKDAVKLTPEQVGFICDRRRGIGGDGVIVVRSSNKADFFMDYINSDGSYAEMCGNGIRCLAKYVYDKGLTTRTSLPVETRAGVKVVELKMGDSGKVEHVSVDMGRPIFEPDRIPTTIQAERVPILDYPVGVLGREFQCSVLSMGNPHCVIFTDESLADMPITYGPTLETHPFFPAKINVEFIHATSDHFLDMRVWERGSGETFACGTGACAAAVAGILKGAVRSPVDVKLLGGTLHIAWNGANSSVLMTGPAIEVFSGTLEVF